MPRITFNRAQKLDITVKVAKVIETLQRLRFHADAGTMDHGHLDDFKAAAKALEITAGMGTMHRLMSEPEEPTMPPPTLPPPPLPAETAEQAMLADDDGQHDPLIVGGTAQSPPVTTESTPIDMTKLNREQLWDIAVKSGKNPPRSATRKELLALLKS